eukprot:16030056-Heterocapsa_arctica.AAC.1
MRQRRVTSCLLRYSLRRLSINPAGWAAAHIFTKAMRWSWPAFNWASECANLHGCFSRCQHFWPAMYLST